MKELLQKIKFHRNTIVTISLTISFFIYISLALILFISTVLLFLRINVNPFIVPAAILFSILITYIFFKIQYKNTKNKIFFLTLGILLIIIIIGILLTGYYYDLSWDGQDYHQVGIIKIKEGWNPIYENLPDTVSNDVRVAVWVNHYPKASWIIAAGIYSFSKNIEYGKIINFLLIVASFLVSLAFILYFKNINIKTALLISLLLALNPVVINECFSYYVDGLMSSLITTLFVAAFFIFFKRKNIFIYGILMSSSIILMNLKFTGVVYLLIIYFGIFIGLIFTYRKKIKPIIFITSICAAVFIFGLLFIGYSPYVKNTLEKGHPFYPIYGKDKVDIITWNYPKNFLSMNQFEKFFRSFFAKTGVMFKDGEFEESKFKMPFTVYDEEMLNLAAGDARTGGFGPFFSGIFILSLILAVTIINNYLKEKNKKALVFFLSIILWIFISVIIIPESWWARLIPQLWIIPIFISLMVLKNNNIEKKNINKLNKIPRLFLLINRIMVIFMVINISIISLCYIILIN